MVVSGNASAIKLLRWCIEYSFDVLFVFQWIVWERNFIKIEINLIKGIFKNISNSFRRFWSIISI